VVGVNATLMRGVPHGGVAGVPHGGIRNAFDTTGRPLQARF
jgi:hypothetical protein